MIRSLLSSMRLNRLASGWSIAPIALCFAACAATPVRAQSCSVSISAVAFGNIDVTSGSPIDTTATLNINCLGAAGQTVRVCPNVSTGSGGGPLGLSLRLMLSALEQLNFNLYADAARTTVWGSALDGSGTASPQIDITLNGLGSGSSSRTIYARVAANQQIAAVGAYASLFTGPSVRVQYAYSAAGACASLAGALETSATFTASATVTSQCAITANDLTFGSTASLASAVDAVSTLRVTCTRNAAYLVALNGGLANVSDPAQRKMTNGAAFITYGLYRDVGRTQKWGAASGVDTQSGVGTGASQSFNIYGRVPAQSTPAPGRYADIVIATVTY